MMTTSHKTKWREARMQIQQEKDKMKLPDGKTCNHCAHIDHCKWLFGISGNETVCSIYPPRFYDDVMTIYHRDGTTTEVVHPFDAMRKCEVHNHADINSEISTNVKKGISENKQAYNENAKDNNGRSKWKAYVPVWGAPAVNKRYLVKLINDWITIATYYLRDGGGYWKDDKGQELSDGVVSLWKGLEE